MVSDSGKDAFWGVSDDNEEGHSLLMGDGVEGISASAACCDFTFQHNLKERRRNESLGFNSLLLLSMQ